MKRQSSVIEARVLIAGCASGSALVLDDALSFWGGFDPSNGEIIDVHHPQYRQLVGGRILCIPESRGSAGTPGGIAETLRNGSGPVAFVLGERDVNISVGTLVANRLYGFEVPVLEVSLSVMNQINSGDQLTIDQRGLISIDAE
jgi:predicted aconitase with swiveling domain